MGKRSVLDSFFAKVDRELQKIFGKDVKIMLAYGSAGLSMKSSGKSQVLVPTTGAYKAACRVFKERCIVQDEWGSTKYDWGTGEQKQAVYRTVSKGDSVKNGHLKGYGHIESDRQKMPRAPMDVQDIVQAYWQKAIQRNKVRRGGLDVLNEKNNEKKDKDYEKRYPEVRGLRYLQSKRIYLGRDVAAAGCIARLATEADLQNVALYTWSNHYKTVKSSMAKRVYNLNSDFFFFIH